MKAVQCLRRLLASETVGRPLAGSGSAQWPGRMAPVTRLVQPHFKAHGRGAGIGSHSPARGLPRPIGLDAIEETVRPRPLFTYRSGRRKNLRRRTEKYDAYTNLTRLKPFVNLQLDLDRLHSSSPFLFEFGNV
jgi:hypothetical protein